VRRATGVRVSSTDRVARAALARVLAWPIERVVIAHGVMSEASGAAFVRRAFAWLLKRDRGAEQVSDQPSLTPATVQTVSLSLRG
jgi:hypothetical protein